DNDPLEKAIFMMHSPPYDSLLDKIPGNRSIGSKAIADFIKNKQPYITLHGHAHETSEITGEWHQITGRTRSFSAAYNGPGLALVIFQIDNPDQCERKII
ncbi:MAG: metallophosphoesterase family protein, partial [Chloroflexota bacterium]